MNVPPPPPPQHVESRSVECVESRSVKHIESRSVESVKRESISSRTMALAATTMFGIAAIGSIWTFSSQHSATLSSRVMMQKPLVDTLEEISMFEVKESLEEKEVVSEDEFTIVSEDEFTIVSEDEFNCVVRERISSNIRLNRGGDVLRQERVL